LALVKKVEQLESELAKLRTHCSYSPGGDGTRKQKRVSKKKQEINLGLHFLLKIG